MRAVTLVSFLVCCALVGSSNASSAPGKRTLVLTADNNILSTHSNLFSLLSDAGLDLTFHLAADKGVKLSEYGEYNYDNILLMAPRAESFARLGAADLVRFVDDGGNIAVVADNELSDVIRDFAAECGVEFDEPGSVVVDHFSYDESDPSHDHTLVITSSFSDSASIVGDLARDPRPVLFSGIGQAVNSDNILAVKVLTGSQTAYSAAIDSPISEYPQSAGDETLLVTAIQARNNARVTFFGSSFMLSNKAFSAKVKQFGAVDSVTSANHQFAKSVLLWTFQHRGVLQASSIRHYRASGEGAEHQLAHQERRDLPKSMFPDPEIARQSLVYRIKDELVYELTIHEFNGSHWVPFEADDVQVEFVMLDAFVRKTLTCVGGGTFRAQFTAPDVYGIFKFRVLYRRPGLTVLHLEDQVSLRPFRHNEYERFITSAFPYYASALSMMAGFLVFSAFFLFSRHRDGKHK